MKQHLDTCWSSINFKNDPQSFFEKARKFREDFEKLKTAKSNTEVQYMKEKYEFLIHENFTTEMYVRIY